MKNRLKTGIGSLAFVLLLVVAVFAYNDLTKTHNPQETPIPSQSQQKEEAAPDFTVQDVNGKDVSLSDFKGKPVVINFWASWCYWCKQEMPDYNKMYEKYHDKGVVFLMVDLTDGTQETKEKGLDYISSNHYSFSPYFDISGDAADKFEISGIPQSVYVNKDGTINATYSGAIDSETIQKSIEDILK